MLPLESIPPKYVQHVGLIIIFDHFARSYRVAQKDAALRTFTIASPSF